MEIYLVVKLLVAIHNVLFVMKISILLMGFVNQHLLHIVKFLNTVQTLYQLDVDNVKQIII